jgi:hypothetical protein
MFAHLVVNCRLVQKFRYSHIKPPKKYRQELYKKREAQAIMKNQFWACLPVAMCLFAHYRG